jgi:hypothetical protein
MYGILSGVVPFFLTAIDERVGMLAVKIWAEMEK